MPPIPNLLMLMSQRTCQTRAQVETELSEIVPAHTGGSTVEPFQKLRKITCFIMNVGKERRTRLSKLSLGKLTSINKIREESEQKNDDERQRD